MCGCSGALSAPGASDTLAVLSRRIWLSAGGLVVAAEVVAAVMAMHGSGSSHRIVFQPQVHAAEIGFHLRGARQDGSSVNQLFIVGADGTTLRQLTHLSGEMNPGYADWH